MSTLYPLSHKASPAASRPESPDLSQLSATTSVPIVSRPLSPTPSETLLLAHRGLNGPLNWKTIKASIRLRNIPYILFAVIWILVLILTIALDKKIARALEPAGRTLRGLTAGWLIPVAILLVISFPPLLGHEIVAVFVGLIWGIGPGFGILAFGTLLGEIMNFYLFRYVFRNRAASYERKNIKYGLLAHVVREGGFWLALMVRLSVIPSHLTTTVFALSGMSSVTYIFAALLSLPKHIVGVAVGSMAHESNTNSTEESHSKIITGVSIGVTAIVTLYSIWYTTRKIEAGKPEFIRMRQEARQAAADAEAEAEAEAISAELPDQDLRSIASSDPVIPAPVELPVAKLSSHLYPPALRVPHSYPLSP